ncbi:MAG: HemK2/MTQ2 family protein methyltransferase [Candidatus Hydrothermarchaeaceae archaeon]
MIYRGVRLSLCPKVYRPSDDSFLLADNVRTKENERVLDMGTGCGIQGIIASKIGATVTSSDISEEALKCARKNAELNGTDITFVKSDLFGDIEEEFDLIMFNPPYLPTEPLDYDDELKTSWDGGDTGREITDRFIEGLKDHLTKNGRVLLIQSSISMPEKTLELFGQCGVSCKVVDEKPLFFEKLYLYKVWR